MKFVFSIGVAILTCATYLNSQTRRCAFDENLQEITSSNPLQKTRIDSFKNSIHKQLLFAQKTDTRSAITIPIVVHIVWYAPEDNLSDEQILSQIEMLNRVFTNKHDDLADVPDEFKSVIGNPNLNFCLASQDPDGKPTNGIIRVKTDFSQIAKTDNLFFDETGGSTAWDPSRYLNIWITEPFGRVGYASFPEDGQVFRDGVVLSSRVVEVNNPDNIQGNGRVAVHEIGHYLGLHHIWGDDLTTADSLCQNDDGFSDTPLQWWYSHRCPSELHTPPFSCGSNDMYVNFMDYSPDQCLSMFTQQQVAYMRTVLENYRPGLLTGSVSCMSSDAPENFSFSIFPNPTRELLTIKINPMTTLFDEMTLFDMRGIKVWSHNGFFYNNVEIPIPQLPNGIYVIKILNVVQKVVIE